MSEGEGANTWIALYNFLGKEPMRKIGRRHYHHTQNATAVVT